MVAPRWRQNHLYGAVDTANVRDALHVLDGLLYHLSELKIKEHYTDTAGYTEQVFALCHLLGFRFAPRIRDLGETRLYTPEVASTYGLLEPLVAQRLNLRLIREHWDELRRLATSIKAGTVTASLMLSKADRGLRMAPRRGADHRGVPRTAPIRLVQHALFP